MKRKIKSLEDLKKFAFEYKSLMKNKPKILTIDVVGQTVYIIGWVDVKPKFTTLDEQKGWYGKGENKIVHRTFLTDLDIQFEVNWSECIFEVGE